MMYKMFKFRLYPTATQVAGLEETIETCRRFYNNLLAERKHTYELEGRNVNKKEQLARIKFYRKENPYAMKVASHTLQVVVADIDRAYQHFFRRTKSGEQPGYPRFKAKNRFRSFGYQEYGNGFKIDGRRLRLLRIGRIAVRWHREIEGRIKTLRIQKKAGKWYAFFSNV